VERHNKPIILHVTVCTWEKRPILAKNDVHQTLITAWQQADDWAVGNYMIMPDHIHMFCSPSRRIRHPVKKWVEFWKRLAGQLHPLLKGVFEWDCWDTQMRTQGHYCRKLEYVTENPVRAELVERSEDWPYQGRLNALWW